MACGTPVVATTAGAFEELVDQDRTGLIVPAGDYPALRDAIATALDDPGRRALWAAACAPHVAAGFRIEDEAAALNAIYRDLLSGQDAAGIRPSTMPAHQEQPAGIASSLKS